MDIATVKPVATKGESGDVDLSESETGSEEDVTGKSVAHKTAAVQPYAPSTSPCKGSPKAEKTEWYSILSCLQPQFNIWKQYSRSSRGSTDENLTTL